jgi:hypothetical protein
MEAVSSAGPSLTAVVGGASVGGGAGIIPCYALPGGVSLGGLCNHSCAGGPARTVRVTVPEGITMALRVVMASRVVRFAGLTPGWIPRGAD